MPNHPDPFMSLFRELALMDPPKDSGLARILDDYDDEYCRRETTTRDDCLPMVTSEPEAYETWMTMIDRMEGTTVEVRSVHGDKWEGELAGAITMPGKRGEPGFLLRPTMLSPCPTDGALLTLSTNMVTSINIV